MAILHVCLSTGWGGLEQYPLTLDKPFKAKGVEVHYWAFENTPFAARAKEQGSSLQVFASRWSVLVKIRSLVSWLKEKHISVIHFHKSTDLQIALILSYLYPKVRLVFTEHMNAKRPKKSIYHRLIYKRLHCVIAISEHTRKNNLTALPIQPEKLIRLYSGIDLERFKPSLNKAERDAKRTQLGIAKDGIAIALPGRITEDKRQDVFIKSFELLKQRLPEVNVKAFVIGGLTRAKGSDMPAVETLLSMVKKSEFSQDIVLTDYRSDIHEVMQAMDIACIPSREEPFGLVVIEAMALGLPVVGSASGAIPEILKLDGHYGLLATTDDPNSFADKFHQLITDEALRKKISANALNRVRKEFDLDLHVERLSSLYGLEN